MGLLGILLGLLIWLAYKGWSVLFAVARSRRSSDCSSRCGAAAARPLDPNLHGQCGGISGAVLSVVSAGCPVRQAHGEQRIRRGHRSLEEPAIWAIAWR